MKKLFLIAVICVASVLGYGQAKDSVNISLKEGVSVKKSGVQDSPGGKYYTEIYEVITDSVVYQFGLEFRSDSTFYRKVQMGSINRKLYDDMAARTSKMVAEQERLRKETIEFVNRFRTSYEVWLLFKLYNVLKKSSSVN